MLAKGQQMQHIVCMNSEVELRDDPTGKIQKVTLVYPEEADISKRKISVLTPVGTALIGLRDGDSIIWETPNGESRQLTVLSVQDLPSLEGCTLITAHATLDLASHGRPAEVARHAVSETLRGGDCRLNNRAPPVLYGARLDDRTPVRNDKLRYPALRRLIANLHLKIQISI